MCALCLARAYLPGAKLGEEGRRKEERGEKKKKKEGRAEKKKIRRRRKRRKERKKNPKGRLGFAPVALGLREERRDALAAAPQVGAAAGLRGPGSPWLLSVSPGSPGSCPVLSRPGAGGRPGPGAGSRAPAGGGAAGLPAGTGALPSPGE